MTRPFFLVAILILQLQGNSAAAGEHEPPAIVTKPPPPQKSRPKTGPYPSPEPLPEPAPVGDDPSQSSGTGSGEARRQRRILHDTRWPALPSAGAWPPMATWTKGFAEYVKGPALSGSSLRAGKRVNDMYVSSFVTNRMLFRCGF